MPLALAEEPLDGVAAVDVSVDGMYAFTGRRASFCDACFTGSYPSRPGEETPVRQLHFFEACDR